MQKWLLSTLLVFLQLTRIILHDTLCHAKSQAMSTSVLYYKEDKDVC